MYGKSGIIQRKRALTHLYFCEPRERSGFGHAHRKTRFREGFETYGTGSYRLKAQAIYLRPNLRAAYLIMDTRRTVTHVLGLRHDPAKRQTIDCYYKFKIGSGTMPAQGGPVLNTAKTEKRSYNVHNLGQENGNKKLSNSDKGMVPKTVMRWRKIRKAGITEAANTSAVLNIIFDGSWPMEIA